MKKSLNPFAFLLGLLAVTYALLVVPEIFEILRQPETLTNHAAPHDATYIQSFLSRSIVGAVRNTIYGSGMLLGLAVLVELVDRIRWNARTQV